MITRPMLAPNDDWKIQQQYVPFPCIGSPKADGFRCYTKRGAKTRSGKDHPNPYVRKLIYELPDGLDGELVIVNGNFRDAQSALSRGYGEPDFEYLLFDYVKDSLDKSYEKRIEDLFALKNQLPEWCKILPQYYISNMEELISFHDWCIEQGYEGVMVRLPSGRYKCNRGTLKEQLILKVKMFTDSECKIVGINEQYENQNETYETELGFTARSNHQENKVPKGIMGSLQVIDIYTNEEFKLGTGKGWDYAFRKYVFENPEKILEKIATYKFLNHGGYDKSRNASMKAFREPWDMS